MFFQTRVHQLREYYDIGELAEQLTEFEWTTCTGFRCADLILVNDSTNPNGLQEYAVLDSSGQIESLTVSWMSPERMIETLIGLLTSDRRTYVPGAAANLGHPAGSCRACA